MPRKQPTAGFDDDEGGDEEPRPKRVVGGMAKFQCMVCGYVYDPREGDPDSSIDPDTPFADLPEDWVCPLCGAGKDQFEKL